MTYLQGDSTDLSADQFEVVHKAFIQRVRDHEPRWEQSRDEDVGMWRCACGTTYAPDDVDRFHKHLVERAEASE